MVAAVELNLKQMHHKLTEKVSAVILLYNS
jgi:hypothetical protein